MQTDAAVECPHGSRAAPAALRAEAAWLPPAVRDRLGDGVCPECIRAALTDWVNGRITVGGSAGAAPVEDGRLLPYGVVPVTAQLGHDARFTGRGITLAMIDSGFYPHPELTGLADGAALRLRAWADASTAPVRSCWFRPLQAPRWPGWSRRAAEQWHGMMTAAVAAGSGVSSRGWYRGFAPNCDLAFVQTWDCNGRITNASLVRALRWLRRQRQRLRLRVVNISVYGDSPRRLKGNHVDAAVRRLVEDGVVVVAAAGNAGERALLPPGTSAAAITVGGADLGNSPNPAAWRLAASNWGRSSSGTRKPDLLAPSVWLAAPVLPGSKLAAQAIQLFGRRDGRDLDIEQRIAQEKLITPCHQHVDGTSFAAAVVAGVAACLLEANPSLDPRSVRRILCETATRLPDVPAARQGAGVICPAAAVARALEQTPQ